MDAAAIEKSNPFGIHFLKAIAVWGILTYHPLAWIALAKGYAFQLDSGNEWTRLNTFLWVVPLLTPATAGAALRISLGSRLQAGRRTEMPVARILALSLSLILIGSIKGGVAYGLEFFFGWSVLQMIGVSFAILLLLLRRSIYYVWVAGAAGFFVTPFLREKLTPLQIHDWEFCRFLNHCGLPQVAIFSLITLLLGTLIHAVWRRSPIEGKYKMRVLLVVSLAYLALAIWLQHYVPTEYFSARLISLPVGALVGDIWGLHYWPILPWFSTVVFGFVLYDQLLAAKETHREKLITWTLLAASLLMMGVHFFCYAGETIQATSSTNLWNPELFRQPLFGFWRVFGVFGFLVAVTAIFARSRTVLSLMARYPVLYQIPYVYSRTVLWAYFFITSLGIPLCEAVGRAMPTRVALVLCPIGIQILWYWIGLQLIHLMDQRRWLIRLSRRVRPDMSYLENEVAGKA